MTTEHPVHPRGTKANILFSSVFGPYAQDDEYGSRSINPMELYHNQVTRVQGPFSLRMFHRSFGLMMIQENIEAPCTILDFPTLDRFIEEIQTHDYDIVGISSIPPNYLKAKKMCELIRTYLPKATIVVGGHIANMSDIQKILGADHIVKGEGIAWFRKFLGQDEHAPIKHPGVISGFGTRSLGITFQEKTGDTAAVVIPSVGCPMGCNFCSTSALFGGKGNHISFYETGDDLYGVMCELEAKLKVRSFFVMDENFLLHKKRALRLLELMEQSGKSWSFYVFSSAGVLKSYDIDQLVRIGVSWIWMGLEGENSQYEKLHGIDTKALIKNLQSHGIGVLGSTIIGLENHTLENIDQHIAHAVSHDTDFHQFMLYTPVPGTPLYEQTKKEGRLLSEDEISLADSHGQCRFNFRHKSIPAGRETGLLLSAFNADFKNNGPSLARIMRTRLAGWKRNKDNPDQRVRSHCRWEAQGLGTTSAGVLWATKKWYKNDPPMTAKIGGILNDIYKEFGLTAKIAAPLLGSIIYFTIKQENKRLSRGWTYEPPTVYDKNAAAQALEKTDLFPCTIRMPDLNEVAERLVPTFSVVSRLKAQFTSYRVKKIAGAAKKYSEWEQKSAAFFEKSALRIKPRPKIEGQHGLVVDMYGVFDKMTAKQFKAKIEAYLKENTGHLAINFSNLSIIEREALLRFFKKLRAYRERIKLVNIDSLKADMADVAEYARNYFEVLADDADLAGSLA